MTISLDKSNVCYKNTPISTVDYQHESTPGNKIMKNESSILIIDDQPDNIRTLSAMLARAGYKVRKALNGETALEAAQVLSPDLILLDIMMPQMDGYEVCSALKASAATREIPVIFLSALSETSDKTQAFAVGGLDYITKPFQAEEVLLRVSHQLTIRSQRRELVEQNYRLQQDVE
jgi:PleD family two-component response regulator